MTSNSERWRELATEPEENKRESRKREMSLKMGENGRERSGKRQNDLKGHTVGNVGKKEISK